MPPDPELKRTAFHEAGHLVASVRLGLRDTYWTTIEPNDTKRTSGHNICDEPSDTASNETIEAYVVSLYAGFAAQRRFDPDEPEDQALQGAADDFGKAQTWLTTIGGQEGLSRAHQLVAEHWETVETMARALLLKRSVGPEEVDCLVAIIDDDEAARAAGVLVAGFGWTAEQLSSVCKRGFANAT